MSTTANFNRERLGSILKTLSHAESVQKDFSYKGACISLVSVPEGHREFIHWTFGEIIFCISGEATIKFPTSDIVFLAEDQSVKIPRGERSAIVESKTNSTILILEIKPERNTLDTLNPWKM